ncbi:MAG: cytochrome c553 [Idiomarinaceae bacterium HL-53]|nr:MAG: cytochrome c553 [Idiomarinaceae bacterium HL-53]CUS47774.1 Cytochrome c553 [Idiomarinaceae bacterium HL-53]
MKKLAILCGMFLFAGSAVAADNAKPEDRIMGDPEAGQEKAQVCAACHGPDGNSPSSGFPIIAGQHERYIVKQLMDYKLGAETNGEQGRLNMVMSGQVANLSEQDMYDLGAYFSAQEHDIGSTPEDVVEQGMALFMGGDQERGITACAACHGPSGLGVGQAGFPLLSGQYAEYTKLQLESFRSGERANDPNGMMRDIANKLTDEDIEVLSQYIRGLY